MMKNVLLISANAMRIAFAIQTVAVTRIAVVILIVMIMAA